MTFSWLYILGIAILAFGLPIFSYLALIYRELGRMTTGRIHEHLEIFENEIEPKLRINRRSGDYTVFGLHCHKTGIRIWMKLEIRGIVHVGESQHRPIFRQMNSTPLNRANESGRAAVILDTRALQDFAIADRIAQNNAFSLNVEAAVLPPLLR